MKLPRHSSVPRKKIRDAAETDDLAAEILGYLAADPERLSRFLDLTGLNPQSLRRTAALPGFASSIVEYLASDDRLLLAFAAANGHDPARIEALRQRLAAPADEGDG